MVVGDVLRKSRKRQRPGVDGFVMKKKNFFFFPGDTRAKVVKSLLLFVPRGGKAFPRSQSKTFQSSPAWPRQRKPEP